MIDPDLQDHPKGSHPKCVQLRSYLTVCFRMVYIFLGLNKTSPTPGWSHLGL